MLNRIIASFAITLCCSLNTIAAQVYLPRNPWTPATTAQVTIGSTSYPPYNLLAPGGREVISVGGREEQTLTVVERTDRGTREIPQFPCRFVKLIGQEGWEERGAG